MTDIRRLTNVQFFELCTCIETLDPGLTAQAVAKKVLAQTGIRASAATIRRAAKTVGYKVQGATQGAATFNLRISELTQRVARLEQRVDSMASKGLEFLADLPDDVPAGHTRIKPTPTRFGNGQA